jgi:hypothetical protein
MKQGIQSFLKSVGETACYALCIVQVAIELTGKEINVVNALTLGIDRGCIKYTPDNRDGNNFYVVMPDKFLSLLTARDWSVRHAAPTSGIRADELVVERYEYKTTSGILGHFKLPAWDSMSPSPVAEKGKLVSLRVFRPV